MTVVTQSMTATQAAQNMQQAMSMLKNSWTIDNEDIIREMKRRLAAGGSFL